MEFQEAVKFAIQKPIRIKTENEKSSGNHKHKWRISFYRFSSSKRQSLKSMPPPNEFLCPISGSVMAEPVIVASGQTFERACIEACKSLEFTPDLADNSILDFSTVIPNLALKSTILKWCDQSCIDPPKALDSSAAEKIVRTLMASQNQKDEAAAIMDSDEDLTRRTAHFHSSSDETVSTSVSISTPLPRLGYRPSCKSSFSEIEILNPSSSSEEDELISKLTSSVVFEIEEAVISLRNMTRTREEIRAQLCTQRLLLTIRSLILSRYSKIQVNAVAVVVNLSLEKTNKVKIVRSGIVLPLIDLLKGGCSEAQEHASGAIHSLAMENENKIIFGVSGALQPLLHMLRSESEQTQYDSGMALYHLSTDKHNTSKLLQLGAVSMLLAMAKAGRNTGQVLLILYNLAACKAGRRAILDVGGVECLVGILKRSELDSGRTREHCVATLFRLSQDGLRFVKLGRAVDAAGVLMKMESIGGGERAKAMARKMVEMMEVRNEKEYGRLDWEELFDSGLGNRNRCGLSSGNGESYVNSAEF